MKAVVNRRGIALMSTFVIMIVLVILAISIVGLSTSQSRYSVKKQNNVILRQTAIAGIYEFQRLLSNEYKYKWLKADDAAADLGEGYLQENDCYFRISVAERHADWCTVTSTAYFEKGQDINDKNDLFIEKEITVTFKKNCFQYAAMGRNSKNTGVIIGGLTSRGDGDDDDDDDDNDDNDDGSPKNGANKGTFKKGG